MARNVNEFVKTLPAARRHKIEKRAKQLIDEEMTLRDLRKTRAITQASLARELGVAQKQISELENRTDMHISTLRRQIKAMGGELKLVAKFPGKKKPITLTGIGSLTA